MNWVLIIAGLLPLWAAIFIIFTNMRVLKDDPQVIDPVPVQAEKPLSLGLAIDQTAEKDEPKSFFAGLLGRFKRDKPGEPQFGAEIDFSEPDSDMDSASLGIPKGLKRLWGVTFILIFIACLVFGLDRAFAYVFKEYRWVIGTPNPWTGQMELATVSTSAIAGLATMISTFRTGLYLLKR